MIEQNSDFSYFSIKPATRLRAPEKLLCNLRCADARDEASELGFDFPSSTSEELRTALEDLMSQRQNEEEEEVVEEELIVEWDEDLEESFDDE